MAINFPTSLDNFTNPSSGNTLDSPSHSLQHSDINDAVEAMQRKVGVGTAVAGSASAGQVLTISAAGTSTWSTPTPGGLVQIVPSSVSVGSGSGSVDANGRITFSGASSISINDVFSTTYRNYYIVVNVDSGSATGNLLFRFRVSGADNTSNVYRRAGMYAGLESAASGFDSNILSTYWYLGSYINGAYPCTTNIELMNPFQTTRTYAWTRDIGNGGTYFSWNYANAHTNETSFTGCTVYGDTGNVTGIISIYGMR